MGWRALLSVAIALLGLAGAAQAADLPVVKAGLLKFGTLSWELDVMRTHGLDAKEGFKIEQVELGNGQATQVALQAGAVDLILNDFLWVSRQRADGADWTFLPYSSALGALMVEPKSPIQTVADLKGKTLGVAGTPIDKSWLLLRVLAKQRYGFDLDKETTHPFAAPPLIDEQLKAGRVDAALTFWPFAAKLEAGGLRRVLSMNDALDELGVAKDLPIVGYVVSDKWIAASPALLAHFVAASNAAKQILEKDDAEWQRLMPMTGAANQAELERLRDAYRAGIPRHWGERERADATKLYKLLADIGGEALVGPARDLAPGTFSAAVTY
jgi:NitT/TauT family transport system substrate-binding protein